MTCQNYVKMPEYSTYEVLRERFNLAIKEGANNFTLSWSEVMMYIKFI